MGKDERKCHDCGKIIKKDDSKEVRTPYKAYVCEECADKNYCICDWCGNLVLTDLLGYFVSINVCDKCYPDAYKKTVPYLSKHDRNRWA